MSDLRGARAIARFVGCTVRQVGNWRRDESDFPVKLRGRMMTTSEFAIRKWLHDRGLEPPESRRGPLEEPEPELEAGQNPPEQVPAVPVELIDPAVVAALPPPSGSVEDDLAIARNLAHRINGIIAGWRTESFGDPAMARLFGQYVEILSKNMTRIAGLEQSLVKLQRERSELLEMSKVADLLAEFVGGALSLLDGLMVQVVDMIKTEELVSHGTSKMDSENLTDRLEGLAKLFRGSLAGLLQEGDDEQKDAA